MNRRDFLTVGLLGLGASGCGTFGRRPSWLRTRRQVLKPDATLAEVVSEVNGNVLGDGIRPGLAAWRSDHVRVSFGPMAMLAGTISVEHPRNFRMQVALPVGGHVADFGSNGEEYWWWTKDQKALAVGKHDEMVDRRSPVPIPFEPEWLLDVLGVIPVDDRGVSLVRLGPKTDAVELVKEVTGSDGRPVTRVRRVRLSTGEVIGHEIRSHSGVAIARAEVIQHAVDPDTGVMLPQKVHVDWPSFGVNFTLHIGRHEVNPRSLTASTFARPTRSDWPVVAVTRPAVGMPSQHPVASEPGEVDRKNIQRAAFEGIDAF